MDIRKQLMLTHSKENGLKIIHHVTDDKQRFKQLIDCFFDKDYRVSQRAAYVVSLSFDYYPHMIEPYIIRLIQSLENPQLKVANKRNIIRILQFVIIPKSERGKVYNKCISFIENPKETIAVRAFSMTVAYNISEYHPALKSELQLLIEHVLNEPNVSSGIQNRGKKIVKKLYS